ncbi:hypothetical protein CK231_22020 [Mesorhizobium loti]|nr:hypothetical protein CK231_22020 [Mesorhizobium loti]PBC07511.1 hypothetical protein CK230_26410 [Mesorhizobium sp. WSM3859]
MPSVNDRFLVEMAGKARHTAMIGRGTRHSSAVGITCKLNGVEPLGNLADVLSRIGHPNSQIDDLLPLA